MGRRLYRPRPAAVTASADGVPERVGHGEVDSVREEWLVEDRWWTARPLRRRYFELTMANGANAVVFCDLVSGKWYSQKGA
jgi:hypothetical protein